LLKRDHKRTGNNSQVHAVLIPKAGLQQDKKTRMQHVFIFSLSLFWLNLSIVLTMRFILCRDGQFKKI